MEKNDLTEVITMSKWAPNIEAAYQLLREGRMVLLFSEDPTDIYYVLKETDTLRAISSRLKEYPLYLQVNNNIIGKLMLCQTSY